MGLIRHPAFKLSLIAGLCFLMGFSYNYHLPRIESFLLIEIERLSEKHSPVRVWAERLHFHLLPLGVVLENVRILPRAPLDKYLAPANLKEAGATLSLWPLLRGEIRLSRVFIRDSELNVFIKSDTFQRKDQSSDQGPQKFKLTDLYRLPVDELQLERVELKGRLDPQNVVFRSSNMNVMIENRYQSLFVEVEAPTVQVKPSGPLRPLNVSLEMRTLVEADQLQISAFKVRADDSFLVASGRFNGDLLSGRLDQGNFDARTKIQLSDLNLWERIFVLKPQLPNILGHAEVNVNVEVQKGQALQIVTDIATENLQVERYKFGSIHGRLNSDLNKITTDSLTIENEAGRLQLEKLSFELKPIPVLKTHVNVVNVDLKKMLENVGVHHVPVLVPVKGSADCTAELTEKPHVNCRTMASLSRVLIQGDQPKKSTIVDVKDVQIDGDVTLTTKDMTFKSEILMGKNSKGRAHGTVDYNTGFKILYEADNLEFGDIQNLANLKMEGHAKVDGSTMGTSDWATIDLNVVAKDYWLEDFPFGQLNGRMTYKAGQIAFSNIQGQYGNTQFKGEVGVDLHKQRLNVNADIPFADLRDIQNVFGRKIQLPFNATGTGQGKIEASGPFHFPDMSYKVHSGFYRGEIAGESFDEFDFNVTSKDGHVQTDRVSLTKSSGVAEAKGQIDPKGQIDLVVVGRSMRLEQSENVLKAGLDLQGLADFTVLIRGQLPKPRIELNGRLSRVVIADAQAQDSVFKLNFLSDRVEGSGQFLGTTLLADATIPFTNEAPFLLKLKVQKWDFTNLFSLVSKSARQLDFSSSVTANINLAARTGGFWNSTGQVEVSEFSIRKGAKGMSSTKPMYLNIREGEVNSNGFGISSGPSYLKLDVVNLKREHLNASLNGKLDLGLFGLFTPFISDLRGDMALSIDLKGTMEKPNLTGSAYVDKGYAKFDDFIHPFSSVRADLLFNDNQILINSVQAGVAGGKLSGDGRIAFSGKSRPIQIKGSFSDAKLNIPEGFHTRGSGTVNLTGTEFPYNMDINYGVTGGEVTYEIGEGGDSTANIKASSYLPKFLNQEAFHPFNFNINVNLKQPVLVNNSLAHTQVTGQIVASGTPDRLLLTGTISPLPGGKVFFHDTPFDISSAFFEYNAAPPSEPKIFLTGTTHVTEFSQDDSSSQARTQEKAYDINLLVQGKGPVPQFLLTSQPPLPQSDIVSLLALGITTSSMDEKTSSDFKAANSSAALGATILQKAGSKRIKESLGVDIKVSSSQPTPDTASTPKVTLSKQWTPKLGASASSTLQANPSNDVKVEYKMNKNVSVVGSWNGKEYVREQTDAARNVFGLDLEYKVQFK